MKIRTLFLVCLVISSLNLLSQQPEIDQESPAEDTLSVLPAKNSPFIISLLQLVVRLVESLTPEQRAILEQMIENILSGNTTPVLVVSSETVT